MVFRVLVNVERQCVGKKGEGGALYQLAMMKRVEFLTQVCHVLLADDGAKLLIGFFDFSVEEQHDAHEDVSVFAGCFLPLQFENEFHGVILFAAHDETPCQEEFHQCRFLVEERCLVQ